jgi:hypothetical protein
VRPDLGSVPVVRMTAAEDPLDALLQAPADAAAVVMEREQAPLAAVRRGRPPARS